MQPITSEKYILQIFQTRFGIKLLKIDEQGGIKGKTPDFEFYENGRRIFVCELKDFRNPKPSGKDGWEIVIRSDHSSTWSRKSNAKNRVSYAINKAYNQLQSSSAPKILVLLNYSPYLSFDNLSEVIQGFRLLVDENNNTIRDTYASSASGGLIKTKKWKIDLYIWINTINGKELAITQNGIQREDDFSYLPTSEIGHFILQRYFFRG